VVKPWRRTSATAAVRAASWALVGPFGLLGFFFAVFFFAFSLTGVAVGAAATADSSPLESGRIISAIATPAPRNAAVASSPAIRRAQR
jgi:hypothetical protein